MQFSIENLIIIGAVFTLAGFVKGVIGFGLPSVALALLTTTFGLKPAISILVLPALFSNLWQGLSGGALIEITKRIWLYLFFASLFTWFGIQILSIFDSNLFAALLGLLLTLYAILSIISPKINLPNRLEKPTAFAGGIISGLCTGLTGSFVFPSVIYLQALRFSRDRLIQAMGITFTVASISLGISLGSSQLFPVSLLGLSAYSLFPTFLGMFFGVKIRNKLHNRSFNKLFLITLLLMGLYVMFQSLRHG